ncbi:choice-of-anchor M domain-containing protein [Actinoplanes sp. NBRC 101535]|uniref:choice-of-anchor M domain-containing protein n=1 Tax=Actinoplanes sp. NBRC 101535 TaxID=3032196 RepID=UPI002557A841|nr:choice-of-anchor M domain-containing protein [Actinoplanes sp. NBRC 101535]
MPLMTRILAVLAAVLLIGSPASADPGDGLSQSLDPSQSVATGPAVLEAGHADIGPRYRDGAWSVQIHDDATSPAVWRHPEEAIFRVRDTARQQIPADDAYAFLGEAPGSEVYVVPQTQQDDVVWIGWNTQDPGVMSAIDRGVTMTLRGVQGPGSLTVYLQSGNLGAPQVLWASAKPQAQSIWAETNTHTHANWVFSKPGAYLVAVDVTADLADGGTIAASTILRFAIGDTTDPAAARAATYAGDLLPGTTPAAAPATTEATTGSLVVAGGAAVAVLALVVLLVARGAAARRRAERDRS